LWYVIVAWLFLCSKLQLDQSLIQILLLAKGWHPGFLLAALENMFATQEEDKGDGATKYTAAQEVHLKTTLHGNGRSTCQ
jgi:hypothetical protein